MNDSIPGFEDLDQPIPGFEDIEDSNLGVNPGKIGRHENILQKAAKAMMNSMPQMGQVPDAQHPFKSGLGAVSQGMKNMVPSYAGYAGGHEAKSDVVHQAIKNPLMAGIADVATDPETIGGIGAAAKGVSGGMKNLANPSKVFGEKIGSMQAGSPNSKVDFFKIISEGLEDPIAKKIIDKSGIIERFGGQSLTADATLSENLANLSLQESQDLVNALKSGVRQAVKEGTVKPTELNLAKMFGGLVKSQDTVFPELAGARKSYGFAKNVHKGTKNALKAGTAGAALGVGGTIGHSFIKGFTGGK